MPADLIRRQVAAYLRSVEMDVPAWSAQQLAEEQASLRAGGDARRPGVPAEKVFVAVTAERLSLFPIAWSPALRVFLSFNQNGPWCVWSAHDSGIGGSGASR